MRHPFTSILNRAAPLWDAGARQIAAVKDTRLGAVALSTRGAVTALEILLVVACAHQISQLFWVLATPNAVDAAQPALQTNGARPAQLPANLALTRVDLFKPLDGGIVAASVTAAPATALNLQLFGIRAGKADGQGSAIIRRPDNTQDVFFPGQEIIGGVTLEQIRPDHVVIRRMGVIEGLYLDPVRAQAPPPPIAQAQATTEGDEIPRRRISATPSELFAAIKAAPSRTASGAAGLRLQPGGDVGLFEDAGFAPGDVLLAVNGQSVGDATRMPGVVGALASARSFTVQFDRGGRMIAQQLIVDR